MDNLEITAIIKRDNDVKEVRFILNHEDNINFRGIAMVDSSNSDFKIDNIKDYVIDLIKKEMGL